MRINKRGSSLIAAVVATFLALGGAQAAEEDARVSRAAVRNYLQSSYRGRIERFTFQHKDGAVVITARLKDGRVKTILVSRNQLSR